MFSGFGLKPSASGFHLVYIVEFVVAFLYFGRLWSFLYCGVSLLWVRLYRRLVKVS